MTLNEIKVAVSSGVKVNWHNNNYEVIKRSNDVYYIKSICNGSLSPLASQSDITMPYDESGFYRDKGMS